MRKIFTGHSNIYSSSVQEIEREVYQRLLWKYYTKIFILFIYKSIRKCDSKYNDFEFIKNWKNQFEGDESN